MITTGSGASKVCMSGTLTFRSGILRLFSRIKSAERSPAGCSSKNS